MFSDRFEEWLLSKREELEYQINEDLNSGLNQIKLNIFKEVIWFYKELRRDMIMYAKRRERQKIKEELLEFMKEKEFEPTAIIDKVKNL